jgi:hypothetical protein
MFHIVWLIGKLGVGKSCLASRRAENECGSISAHRHAGHWPRRPSTEYWLRSKGDYCYLSYIWRFSLNTFAIKIPEKVSTVYLVKYPDEYEYLK